MNLEQFVPTLFESDKRISASVFWRRVEESFAIPNGQPEVTSKMYRTVAKMFSDGLLGLSDGCYYLKEGRR